jgi:large subunit ribosomal protein L19
MNIMDKIHNENMRSDIPPFRPGDTLRVYCKISEGEKDRIQVFEGVCISRKRGGIQSSFTVRKMSYGVGVERIFPLHSPQIEKIEVMTPGRVRRSRLYYLRDLSGKAARIQRQEREVEEMLLMGEETSDEAAAAKEGDKARAE